MKSKLYTTTLSINKKNLIDNINFFKKKKNKIIAMIKANAYGHGDIEIAKVLEKENKQDEAFNFEQMADWLQSGKRLPLTEEDVIKALGI